MPEPAIFTEIADDGALSVNGTATAHIGADLRQLAWRVEDLQPSPDNARKHADGDVTALMTSLKQHGQQKPVVAKCIYRGVANAVLAGNGTLQAARRLGWSHVAVAWFDGTDEEAQQYAVRDNRTAELSRWDTEQLAALQADGVNLLALWHDDAALADLLGPNCPTPKFEPETPLHRLDQLAPHCLTCTCRKAGAK